MKGALRISLAMGVLLAGLACSILGGGSSQPTQQPAISQGASTPTEGSRPEVTSQVSYLDFSEGMTLTTPTSGGGIRPVLAWDPVDGADWYGVYLYAPNHKLYWSWQGRESSVPVGGRPKLNDDSLGPSAVVGMTWSVIAYDAEDLPVASGGPRPIGP
jgi:hypothetical protein